jgi:hypothetical protein
MNRYPSPAPVPGEELDAERAMVVAEREGKLLNDRLCAECPDPGLCGAERSCVPEGRSW